MKKFPIFCMVLGVLVLFERASAVDYPPGRLFVTFQPNAVDSLWQDSTGHICCGINYIDSVNIANKCSGFRSDSVAGLDITRENYIVTFPDTVNLPAVIAAYQTDPNVLWARPDYYLQPAFTPNDSFFLRADDLQCRQWNMDSAHCQFEKAWDITKGDTNVVIAITDGGILYSHPDLRGNLWINRPEDINNSGFFEPWPKTDTINGITGDIDNIDQDSNLIKDDVAGYNFPDSVTATPYIDTVGLGVSGEVSGHGTLVSSIAAGVTNNTIGTAGAGFKCRMMPITFVHVSGLIKAIAYAAKMGAKVINTSWVIPGNENDPQLEQAVNAAFNNGVVLVAATGNSAHGAVASTMYPAAYANVLSVTGLKEDDVKHTAAVYNTSVDLSAPIKAWGAHFRETTFQPIWDYGFAALPEQTNPCEDTLPTNFLGTSLSAPLVAGAAGLIKSAYPSMTSSQIFWKLKSSTDNVDVANAPFVWADRIGTGRLNAFKAVTFFGNIPNLANDTTLSGIVYVSGDIRVRAGKRLRLAAGTVIRFYPGDVMKGGVNVNLAEIIVESGGVLEINGTAASPVQLVSFLASPGSQDWYGVRVLSGGSLKATYGWFKNAYAGIDFQNSASDTVKNCLFQGNFMYGLITANPNLKVLFNSFLDQTNYGLYANIANSFVSGNYFKNNKYGINAYKSYGTYSGNTFIGTVFSEFGFRSEGFWAGQTQWATFSNNLDSGIFSQAAVVVNGRTKITNSRIKIIQPIPDPGSIQNYGILGLNDSGSVRNSIVSTANYSSDAPPTVRITGSALDLGKGSAGGNSILRGPDGKAVDNATGSTVFAENVWWGTESPDSLTLFTGPVDFRPYLEEDPNAPPGGPKVIAGVLPLEYSLSQNYPNPFNPRTSISFALPQGGKVKLEIFNLLGQKVRTLLDEEKGAGFIPSNGTGRTAREWGSPAGCTFTR